MYIHTMILTANKTYIKY